MMDFCSHEKLSPLFIEFANGRVTVRMQRIAEFWFDPDKCGTSDTFMPTDVYELKLEARTILCQQG